MSVVTRVQARRQGFDSLQLMNFLRDGDKTKSRAHPVSYPIGTGTFFPETKRKTFLKVHQCLFLHIIKLYTIILLFITKNSDTQVNL